MGDHKINIRKIIKMYYMKALLKKILQKRLYILQKSYFIQTIFDYFNLLILQTKEYNFYLQNKLLREFYLQLFYISKNFLQIMTANFIYSIDSINLIILFIDMLIKEQYQNKLGQIHMSVILKVTYQHKHKKYRYHSDRSINFNQIRKDLSINIPPQITRYQIQQSNKDIFLQEQSSSIKCLSFHQQQLIKYLRTNTFSSNQLIKIRVVLVSKNEDRIQMNSADSDINELSVPLKIEKIRSRSQEIDIRNQKQEEINSITEITQQFICNSQINYLNENKSIQILELQRQLAKNNRKIKFGQDKRRYTNIEQIYQYWNDIKNDFNNL